MKHCFVFFAFLLGTPAVRGQQVSFAIEDTVVNYFDVYRKHANKGIDDDTAEYRYFFLDAHDRFSDKYFTLIKFEREISLKATLAPCLLPTIARDSISPSSVKW